MKVSEDALIKALKAQNIDATIQKETDQVFFTFMHEDQKFPSFIRQLNDGNLLQIMIFIPVAIQEKGLTDLSRFLHMANKELDLPGFGMDEASSTVFYRVVLPSVENTVDDDLFNAYIKTCQDICITFCSIIQALGIGAMTMDEVITQLKASVQK